MAGHAGPAGADLASTAREAFMTAASGAELVAAVVALVGAALALRYLPAREGTTLAAVPAAAGA